MQDTQDSIHNNEIDLYKFFTILWAYKLLIILSCALGIFLAGYYILNTEKKFTSIAIFRLGQKGTEISLSQKFSQLTSLSGQSQPTQNTMKDMITGRVFIEKLDSKLNLQSDPYFNTYDPNAVEPIWKSLVKRAIGWQNSLFNVQELIWQGIVNQYKENVVQERTKEGSIKIMVTHENSIRAAEIANGIMNEIITSSKNKIDKDQDAQLSFLSNTLAKSLSDLELTQKNLKEFTMKNSAEPLQSFAAESSKLIILRENLKRTSELHDAVAALSLMMQKGTKSQNNYLALREQFPIVDQVEFRRILGQNETINTWDWPKYSSVSAVLITLSDRKIKLISEIKSAQIEAERTGLAVEAFAKINREAKIAEATYKVLMEQVKAQSMLVGYRPDRTEVYEYAFPTIGSSAPNRLQALTLGASAGIFFGILMSCLISLLRGVYNSKTLLISGAQAQLNISIKSLRPLVDKNLDDINKILMKKPRSALRDMAADIYKSGTNQIVVTSSRSSLTGNHVARALAGYMQSDDVKIAIIDFSSKHKLLNTDDQKLSVESFVIVENATHISVLMPKDGLAAIELISKKDFWKTTQSLGSNYDLVFLCADNDDAISLLHALKGQKSFHITAARTNHTKSATLSLMRLLLPIQGLIYD